MEPHLSAILVAAGGKSQRMGCCNLLLPLGESPVIIRSINAIRAAGIDDIIVVVGQEKLVEQTVTSLPVRVVVNPDPDSDMSASIRIGLEHVSPQATGVFIAPADYPLVRQQTYRFLSECHAANPQSIVIPVHEGRRGHPTILPAAVIEEMRGAPVLRDLVVGHADTIVPLPVADKGVTLNLDTPQDYRLFADLFQGL